MCSKPQHITSAVEVRAFNSLEFVFLVRMVGSNYNNNLQCWDLQVLQLGHTESITSIAYFHNGNWIATAGDGGLLTYAPVENGLEDGQAAGADGRVRDRDGWVVTIRRRPCADFVQRSAGGEGPGVHNPQ